MVLVFKFKNNNGCSIKPTSPTQVHPPRNFPLFTLFPLPAKHICLERVVILCTIAKRQNWIKPLRMKLAELDMTVSQKENRFLLILMLGLLTAMGPFSIDLYLPAFSEIASSLGTDISSVSLSLSSFFIGLAFGQIMYGPLLERFGRKKPIYFGLSLYVLTSIGIAMAASVEMMILLRFFQAIGSCAGLVSARAIIRDLFDGQEMAKVFSTLIMVVAISPIIAPSIGGILSTHFHWSVIFLVLMGMALVVLLGTIFLVPETKGADPEHSLRLSKVFGNYKTVFKHPVFFVNAFSAAIAYAGLYAYLSGSPHLYLDLLGLTEQQYGWIFAIIASGLITATQINNRLLKKYTSEQIVRTTLVVQAMVGVSFLLFSWLIGVNLYLTTFLLFAFLMCLGFIFPNASALSLEPMGHMAGNASALMGGIQMAVGAGASALVGLFHNTTSIPMATIMAVCSLLALSLFYFGWRWVRSRG
jgi:DHA1 family bicyclomycin/chloramphenicol resistance-like MFS transporter